MSNEKRSLAPPGGAPVAGGEWLVEEDESTRKAHQAREGRG